MPPFGQNNFSELPETTARQWYDTRPIDPVFTERHWRWVEAQGWHNKTPLEALALIAAEAGEAVNECRGRKPTPQLAEELADIVLRVIDLAACLDIDINLALARKVAKNAAAGKKPGRVK